MSLKLVKRPGSDNWYVRGSIRGQAVFESTGTDRQEAAEAIRIRLETDLLDASIHGPKAVKTFMDAAVAYLETGAPSRFVGDVDDAGRWSGLMGHFGMKKLRTFTQSDLDAAARLLCPKAKSPDTLNRQVYTPFITIWKLAVKQGWAEPREWSRPRKPKGTAIKARPTRSGTRPISYETAFQFVRAMSPAPGLVMTALFYTGMRPIELFSLDAEEDDIRPADRWIVLRGSKTGAGRGIPMHDFLVPIFEWLVARGGRLFRMPNGKPYRMTEDAGGQIKGAIRSAADRTKLFGISPYTARHTVSTQLVINGVHPHIKDQILGHAATDMSRRYTSVPQAPLIEAINTLPVPQGWRDLEWIRDPGTRQKLVDWRPYRTKTVHAEEKNVTST